MKRLICTFAVLFLCGCTRLNAEKDDNTVRNKLELRYAKEFSAEYLDNGCISVTIGADRYTVVPENAEIPSDTGGSAVIRQPVENVYNAASSAMDLIDGAGALGSVMMTSTKYDDWALPSVKEAIDKGEMYYVGKYSAPDYEALMEADCSLAIESTMIYHSPEVKEKLEELGIPVLVERSSYETDPLGRMEWIKLYGILFGCEERANELFNSKISQIEEILSSQKTDKKAAFFYINSSGGVVIRKPNDYVPEMMRMAGGEYIFDSNDLGTDENALSTMTIQPEVFCEKAWDADILIYNSTILGEIASMNELTEKYPMLKEFNAVKNGDVWCTEKNMFQQTTGAADMIKELHSIFVGEAEDKMNYLYRLEEQ